MPGKKIIITISGGFVSRNILRSGVLERLLDKGAAVVLLAPEEKKSYYEKEFGRERVKVAGLKSFKETKWEAAARFVARNSVGTKIVFSLQIEHLLANPTPLSFAVFLLKRFIVFLGYLPGFYFLIRLFDLKAVPEKSEIGAILSEENPDIVFATNVMDEMDVSVLREAKRRGLKTVGMVKSWDNLTGHGIVRIVPDILIVHSRWLFNLARNLHKISPDKIKITGIPQYDSFFKKDFLKPRDEFLRSLGFDPARKLILFSAIGTDFAPYEWEIPQMINDAIDSGVLPADCFCVARPHPNLGIPPGSEPKGRNIFIDRPARYIGGASFSWEMEKNDINHFANMLYHADVVVTGASTITMDAAIFDRPIINVAFDGNHKLPYYRSAARCYEIYTHYVAMVKTGGARIVASKEELFDWIKKYLAHPEIDREGRENIIKEFVGYTDGRSAERLADAALI